MMDRPQMLGMGVAIASTILGAIGVANTRPLPPSARLGALAAVDTNNDGRISRAEWRAAGRASAGFAALDKNHDGSLSPSEALPGRTRGGPRK
jgi:hypothetical protein